MGEGHALGLARGAAGIKQLGDVVFVKIERQIVGGSGGQQTFVFMGRQSAGLTLDHHKMLGGGQRGLNGLDQRREILVIEKDFGGRVVEDVGDLGRGQADVDGVEDRPGLQHAVIGFQEMMGVVANERDPITFLHAEAAQGVGQFVGALGVLAIGEGLVAVNDANFVAEIKLGAVAELEELDRGTFGTSAMLRLARLLHYFFLLPFPFGVKYFFKNCPV